MEYRLITSYPDSALERAWNECLNECDFATHYTSPAIFKEVYFQHRRPFAILAMDGAIVQGLVTGLRDDREIVCGASGSPHVCLRRSADSQEVGKTLGEGLRASRLRRTGLVTACTWVDLPSFEAIGFRRRQFVPPLGTILLDLSKGADQLFREFSETRRHKIRRAIKAGVQVTEMNLGRDFADYYELYRHWSSFKQLALQPYEVQRAAFSSTENRLVLVARHEDRIIGVSTFRFRRPGIVEYAANVSRREETRVRQNDLLLWRGIEWSVEQGAFQYFSMAGAHFFLQKFGGQVYSTYEYTLDLTFLKRYIIADGTRNLTTRAYQRLPNAAKTTLKKLLRSRNAQE